MSLSVEAKLFYGYVKRAVEDDEDTDEEETPWDKAHTRKVHGCTVDLYGYSGNLGYILAVEEALYETEWDHVFHLMPYNFQVKPEWDEQLRQAAETFGLDVTGMQPGWFLVCLYF